MTKQTARSEVNKLWLNVIITMHGHRESERKHCFKLGVKYEPPIPLRMIRLVEVLNNLVVKNACRLRQVAFCKDGSASLPESYIRKRHIFSRFCFYGRIS